MDLGADLLCVNKKGFTALQYSVKYDQYECFKLLIKQVPEPIDKLIKIAKHSKIILPILKKGAEVISKCIAAADKGDLVAFKNEFVKEEFINCPDSNGFTALMLAVQSGNASLVEFILQHGGNPDLKNNDGQDSYSFCASPNVLMVLPARPDDYGSHF